jgi:hypothetical protein
VEEELLMGELKMAVPLASPDECGVEFGLKLGGETGVIVAKGTAEVNFVITLTWKKP